MLKTTKNTSIDEILKSYKHDNKFLFEMTNEEKKQSEKFEEFCSKEDFENEQGKYHINL